MTTIDERYQEGCLLLELGKEEKALEIFSSILEEDPEHYQTINKIGVIYAVRGELDRAQEYFEGALDINLRYAPSLVNLGNILKEAKEYEEAKRFYQSAIEEDPDYAIAYHNMAVMYKENNSYDMYMKYIKEYKRAYRRHSYSKEAGRKRIHFKRPGLLLNITLIISLTVFILFLVRSN